MSLGAYEAETIVSTHTCAKCFCRRLKPLDVKFMKAVDHKVNIVPVIAKADTLTKQEVQRLKHKVRTEFAVVSREVELGKSSLFNEYDVVIDNFQILKQIEHEGIQLYPLPDCDEDEDEDYKEQCRQLKVRAHISRNKLQGDSEPRV